MTQSVKNRYRKSLYANLLTACVASEEREVLRQSRCSKMVTKVLPSDKSEGVRSFVMRWDPAVSGHKVVDFEMSMEAFQREGFYYEWSIWDYQQAREGDRFYMLKVGEGRTGIVMHGFFCSDPFVDEDWSGRGRVVHYVRMLPDCMIHPDHMELITTQMLDDAMPSVNWNEGHSGELLDDVQVARFEEMWKEYITLNNLIL